MGKKKRNVGCIPIGFNFHWLLIVYLPGDGRELDARVWRYFWLYSIDGNYFVLRN